MWPVVHFFFPICPMPKGVSVESLHAAGGIFVSDTFEHLEGKIEISGSSAWTHGGAVLRSSSGVFGAILRWL